MSANETFQRASFRHLAIGLGVGAIVSVSLLYFVSGLPFFINFLAVPFAFVPDQLGLFERVIQDDVIPITVPAERELSLSEGQYFIYSINLLPAKDRILIKSQESNWQVDVPFILDGFNGYDPEIVAGRPIAEFQIEQAGIYEIYLRNLPENAQPNYELFIVPDYSFRNRTVIFLSCIIHLAIVGVVCQRVYYWRNKDRIQREAQVKDEKREQFEAWMKKQKK